MFGLPSDMANDFEEVMRQVYKVNTCERVVLVYAAYCRCRRVRVSTSRSRRVQLAARKSAVQWWSTS